MVPSDYCFQSAFVNLVSYLLCVNVRQRRNS